MPEVGRLLNFSATNPTMQGEYAEIHSANRDASDDYDGRLFSFVRWQGDERVIVVSNFDSTKSYELFMTLPPGIVTWELSDNTGWAPVVSYSSSVTVGVGW